MNGRTLVPLVLVASTLLGCSGTDDPPPDPVSDSVSDSGSDSGSVSGSDPASSSTGASPSTGPSPLPPSTSPSVPASGDPTAPDEPLAFRDALQPIEGRPWHAPYGVDVASDGTTWVFDTEDNALLAFTPDGTNVIFRKSEGSGDGQFDSLGFGGLAIGPDDHVHVVDNGNARIQVFDDQGNPLRSWGERGDGPGQFQRAIGIAVDDAGQVYVTDDARPEVQVFDSRGTWLRSFGEPGDGPGGILHATGIDVDADGNAWVADYEARRIQVFDPDGAVVATWRIPGPIGTTGTPEGIVVLDDGRVWVTSYRGGQVLQVPVGRTTPEGQDPEPWPLVAGGEGSGDGTFQAPVDLAVAPDGTLVVTDQRADTVQRFGPAG